MRRELMFEWKSLSASVKQVSPSSPPPPPKKKKLAYEYFPLVLTWRKTQSPVLVALGIIFSATGPTLIHCDDPILWTTTKRMMRHLEVVATAVRSSTFPSLNFRLHLFLIMVVTQDVSPYFLEVTQCYFCFDQTKSQKSVTINRGKTVTHLQIAASIPLPFI